MRVRPAVGRGGDQGGRVRKQKYYLVRLTGLGGVEVLASAMLTTGQAGRLNLKIKATLSTGQWVAVE